MLAWNVVVFMLSSMAVSGQPTTESMDEQEYDAAAQGSGTSTTMVPVQPRETNPPPGTASGRTESSSDGGATLWTILLAIVLLILVIFGVIACIALGCNGGSRGGTCCACQGSTTRRRHRNKPHNDGIAMMDTRTYRDANGNILTLPQAPPRTTADSTEIPIMANATVISIQEQGGDESEEPRPVDPEAEAVVAMMNNSNHDDKS